MPITNKQRQRRKKHIGSSDMPAILGLSRFRTAYDVWLEKTDRLEPDDSKEKNYITRGNVFESGVLQFAETELGQKLKRNQYRVHKQSKLAANMDAVVKKSDTPVEAKTAGLFSPLKDEWGAPGTDEVPVSVIIQTHVQMICCQREIAHISAFIANRGLNLFKAEFDKELSQIILDKAGEFWDNFVEKDTPPEGLPSYDIIRRVKRDKGIESTVPDEIVGEWLAAKDKLSEARKERNAAEVKLLKAMGDAELANSGDGIVSFKKQHRSGYTVAPKDYRVLRFKKGQV